jgi:phospholipid/cholesterol/gamma-HCH transport system substrate-binding protein
MRGRYRNLAVVVVTTAVGIGFFVFLLLYTQQFPGTSNGYQVKAVMPTSASLATGARVTMAGYQVGRVQSVQRRGIGGLVTMRLTDDRVTPIPEDSRVTLRQRTALGENYVEITAGHSKRDLADKGVLPLTQADEYVDVDQVLSVLQGQTRRRAQELIQGLGGALDANGTRLRQLLGGTSGVITNTARLVTVLDRHRAQIPDLVQHLDDITAAIGERSAAIDQIGRAGLATFQAVGARDQALRSSIDQLPATLRAVKSLTAVLGSVSVSAAPIVARASAAVGDLKPTVRLLTPAARNGIRVTSALGDASPKLAKLLAQVQPLGKAARTTLPNLQQTLCQAQPAVEYLRPYIGDITAAVTNLGSSANAYDALGHLVRLEPVINDNTLVGLPDSVSSAAFKLLHTGLLAKQSSISYNPYPMPGQIGKERAPETGQILGPAQYKGVYTYPRVKAAC